MSVVQKKDGRWCAVYRDADKKQRWEYFGRGLPGETAARDRDRELRGNTPPRPYTRQRSEAPTFYSLADAYLEAKTANGMPVVSRNCLVYKLTRHILPDIGHLPATRITREHLAKFVNKRLAAPVLKRTGHKDKPIYKPWINPDGTIRTVRRITVQRDIADIQAILNWAVKERYITKNPVAGFEKPKGRKVIIMPPTLAETHRMIDNAVPHLIRALGIAYYTGLRPGRAEMFGITWEDFDFDEKTVLIRSAIKGGPTSRTVPLHKDFVKMLKRWKAEDETAGIKTRCVIHYNEKPVKSVKRAFAAAKRRAGITRKLRPYDFRHVFVSSMLAHGGDLKATSQMAGHSREDTTTRFYQHVDLRRMRDNIALIPTLDLANTDG
jgi:integrase